MGSKPKAQMTPEEHEAVCKRMAELREMAIKKRAELMVYKQKTAKPVEPAVAAPPPPPPPMQPAPPPPAQPPPTSNMLDIIRYHEDMKRQIKEKYKAKFSTPKQVEPPAPPPPRNIVEDTARDQLRVKVDEEVRRMAYKSLFGI
jgi:hypothetical protein